MSPVPYVVRCRFEILDNLLTPDATSFGGLVGGPICGTLESAWILAGIKR